MMMEEEKGDENYLDDNNAPSPWLEISSWWFVGTER